MHSLEKSLLLLCVAYILITLLDHNSRSALQLHTHLFVIEKFLASNVHCELGFVPSELSVTTLARPFMPSPPGPLLSLNNKFTRGVMVCI